MRSLLLIFIVLCFTQTTPAKADPASLEVVLKELQVIYKNIDMDVVVENHYYINMTLSPEDIDNRSKGSNDCSKTENYQIAEVSMLVPTWVGQIRKAVNLGVKEQDKGSLLKRVDQVFGDISSILEGEPLRVCIQESQPEYSDGQTEFFVYIRKTPIVIFEEGQPD